MHPYAQDLRVAYARMADWTARSERVRSVRAARLERAVVPVAAREHGQLVGVVRLRLDEPDQCGCGSSSGDDRIAS